MPTLADQEYDLETLELVNRIVRMPGFARVAELIEQQRETYFENLARGLAVNSQPLDQRELDYKRGFWQGAIYATRRLPKLKAAEWDKMVAEADKEGENTG